VVRIAQRLERGPVDSRMGVFPEVSSEAAVDVKARRAGVNQGLDGD